MTYTENTAGFNWKPTVISAALVFMYSVVLAKLAVDWWSDDNYSHGLLVPIVIAYIVWLGYERLLASAGRPQPLPGLVMIAAALFALLAGTLASVLYVQRISLLVMIAGVVVYFFGFRLIGKLGVPFLLLLLAIPLPQLIFNKIAFPLQLFASKLAGRVIALLGIPAERLGNVIEIPYIGSGELISLEVVEACSGIRSLMTLITLALILGYFTRERRGSNRAGLGDVIFDPDILRTVILMAAAVPVALLTNSARVIGTGILARYYGQAAVEGIWHDISGSIVFITGLVLLIAINFVLARFLGGNNGGSGYDHEISQRGQRGLPASAALALFAAIMFCGLFVNWFQYRDEAHVVRRPLKEMPANLGGWEQRNEDIRFDHETEAVLRASDYVMRDYYGPGKRLNLYVGYYASQRSGSTYHSPLSCLPGTGWELGEPQLLEISTPAGRQLTVNRYIARQGEHEEFLIYWYQGRGRVFASEYQDKIYTSLDSVIRRRSDGAMIRIMTPVGKDAGRSLAAAVELTGLAADQLGEFVPD